MRSEKSEVRSKNIQDSRQTPEHRPSAIDFRLYLITDRKLFSDNASLEYAVEQALKGGVKAVQLREKDLGTRDMLAMAYRMREMTTGYDARLFINDRVDIALAVGADGVHLGGSGMPPQAARKAAGKALMIGVSAHSVEQAETAEQAGADFITVGPVYETPSKMSYGAPIGLDVLKRAKGAVSVPVFAIGGVSKERVYEVLKAGAYGIALISAILASDSIQSDTEEFMRLLK